MRPRESLLTPCLRSFKNHIVLQHWPLGFAQLEVFEPLRTKLKMRCSEAMFLCKMPALDGLLMILTHRWPKNRARAEMEIEPVMKNRSLSFAVSIGLVGLLTASGTSAPAAQAPFYEGKTLRVLIASN